MPLYQQFKTDGGLEKNGIVLDYGDFRVTIARAGGANKRFARSLEARTRPYRRAIQTETMDPERAVELLREVYAESVILRWETQVEGEWKSGIEAPDGTLQPFSKENVLRTLNDLPDLFQDIQDQASKAALFRETLREDDAGN